MPPTLTTLPSTKEGQSTLTADGRTYRVKRLRSKALPPIEEPKKKRLSNREKKQLLSQGQKDAINFALKIDALEPTAARLKLTKRVVDRQKAELRRELGLGKLTAKQKRTHPETWHATDEALDAEHGRLMSLLAWFQQL